MGIVYDGICKGCGYKITLCKCREPKKETNLSEKVCDACRKRMVEGNVSVEEIPTLMRLYEVNKEMLEKESKNERTTESKTL